MRGVLRPAFQMAVDDDVLHKNPFGFELAGVVVNDSVTIEALTREQMRKFLKFVHDDKHWLDGTCDGHLCAESEIPELVMDDNYNIIDGCMLEIFLNIGGHPLKK